MQQPRWNWSDTMFLAMLVFILICLVNSLFGCITINVTAPGLQVPAEEVEPNAKTAEPEKDQSLWL